MNIKNQNDIDIRKSTSAKTCLLSYLLLVGFSQVAMAHHDGDGVGDFYLVKDAGIGLDGEAHNTSSHACDDSNGIRPAQVYRTLAQEMSHYGLAMGCASIAGGLDSIAIGYGAHAGHRLTSEDGDLVNATATDSAIAIGRNTQALGNNAIAIGASDPMGSTPGARALGDYSVSFGYNALASSDNSIALGRAAFADFNNSVAIGFNARTTATNQITLGNADSHYRLTGLGTIGRPEGDTGLYTVQINHEGILSASLVSPSDGGELPGGPVAEPLMGDPGIAGPQGDPGVAGPQGSQGTPGVMGVMGDPGTMGDPGAMGDQGSNGWTPVLANVVDGERVVQQVTGWTGGSEGQTAPATGSFIGASGAMVSSASEATDIRGAQGATGATGAQGDSGNNGWSPVLTNVVDGERVVQQVTGWTGGSEGHTEPATGLFIGASGAMVSSASEATDIRGAQGATGAQGDAGATGAQGVQGDIGATGAQGEAGETGVQGAQGDIGATGAQGDAGATGAQGVQGDIGATGAQGVQGINGQAANAEDLNQIRSDIGDVHEHASRGVAISIAMHSAYLPQNRDGNFSLNLGHWSGETAVGFSTAWRADKDTQVNAGIGFVANDANLGARLGVLFEW